MGFPAFLISLFAGAAALALWVDVRLGGRGPSSLARIVLHALGALLLLRAARYVVVHSSEATEPALIAIFGVLLPALVYTFLTSLWVLKMVRGVMPR